MGTSLRATLCVSAALAVWAGRAGADMVVEWWGQADYCRHKGMTIAPADKDGHALIFDLSPIPKGAKVYHASLRVHTRIRPVRTDKRAYMNAFGTGVFYYDPFRLYNEIRPDAPIEIHVAGGGSAPLKLEGPQFKSFDATEAVRRWVSGTRANKGFRVKRLDRWVQEMTVLDVRYEGKVKDPPAQAKDIKVVHRKGQTFIAWTEVEKIITKEEVLWKEFEALFKKHGGPRKGKFYRIYRHSRPITAKNLHEAELIDEIWPLSGYDARTHQHVVQGENWVGLDGEVHVLRYVIEDPPAGVLKPQGIFRRTAGEHGLWLGKQLPLHTGLYVHQVRKAGKAHYAVTACINGVENTRDITAANSPPEPVAETVGPGEPILYRVLSRDAGRGRGRRTYETQCYLYWAAPPYANQPRRPHHIVVGLGGLSPSQTVQVRHRMKNMYGNELYRGIRNGYPIPPGARILLIVDDAAFQAKGYYDSWNTLKPRRAPSKYVEYPVQLEKVLTPWAKGLPKRGPVKSEAKP